MEEVKAILEVIAYFITIIGAPVAVIAYFVERKKERRDREYGTYNALDDKYIEFLNLCLQHPDLNIYYSADVNPHPLTVKQKVQKYIIYEILVCLLERAFLMYREHGDKVRKSQWEGWKKYMEEWMKNKNFKEAWDEYLGDQYDVDFVNYMNSLVLKKEKDQ